MEVIGELDARSRGILRNAVSAALARHEVIEAHVNVLVMDDPQIAELNHRHLGHEGPTDVLSFDMTGGVKGPGPTKREGGRCVEGEIAISRETAKREAQARGHAVEAELALYAVHGTLHLLGHDDSSDESSAAMHAVEDEILSALGFGRVFAHSQSKSVRRVGDLDTECS